MNGIKYASLVGILATACASVPVAPVEEVKPSHTDAYRDQRDIARKLGVSFNQVEADLPGGYATDRATFQMLKPIAGFLAGTVRYRTAVREEKGSNGKVVTVCFGKGVYSLASHPESMETALEVADQNGDKLVTHDEGAELNRAFCDALVEEEKERKQKL